MKRDNHPYPFPPNAMGQLPERLTGDEPISSLAGLWLHVECPDHGVTMVPLRLLSAKLGWKLPLGRVVPRLKCRQCGGRPSKLALIDRANADGGKHGTPNEIDLLNLRPSGLGSANSR